MRFDGDVQRGGVEEEVEGYGGGWVLGLGIGWLLGLFASVWVKSLEIGSKWELIHTALLSIGLLSSVSIWISWKRASGFIKFLNRKRFAFVFSLQVTAEANLKATGKAA